MLKDTILICPRFVINIPVAMERYFLWLTGIDFEHRHKSNSHLFYLFKHVGQYNDSSPKIRSPNRGKNRWIDISVIITT